MRKINNKIIISIAGIILLTAVSGWGKPSGNQPTGPIPGKFVVKLTPKANPGSIRQSLASGVTFKKLTLGKMSDKSAETASLSRYYIYHHNNPNLTEAEAIAEIGQQNIEYIEPDYYLEFFDLPTDPLFPDQWYLNNTGQEYFGIQRNEGPFNDQLILKSGTPGKDINIAPYYDNPPTESTRVVVAVIDTGTDLLHPELQGRIWHNPDEIPDNGLDDDHNGYIDDIVGYDISGDSISFYDVKSDNDPTDMHGHGTHIAGIIAANRDGQGVVGIMPETELMTVKVRPNATTAIGAEGIIYAVNAGAQILSISWGTPYESLILHEAIRYAIDNGVIVCVAAGNSGTNDRLYPAAFDSILTVGAGNSDGYVTDFSSWGSHIDLIAPGLDILSLRAKGTDMYVEGDEPNVRVIGPDSLYYLSDGTSMAAPMVAGAAAVLLSVHPDLSKEEVENALKNGATDLIDPWNQGDTLIGPDSISGYGYLNIQHALDQLLEGGIYIVSPIAKNRLTGAVDIMIAAVGNYTGGWELEYSEGLESENWQSLTSGTEVPSDSLAMVFNMPSLNNIINLRLTDDNNHQFLTSFTYVNGDFLEIASPSAGSDLKYSVPIHGSVYGPNYDSLMISYKLNGLAPEHLYTTTKEFFDTLIYNWNISGVDAGSYDIILSGAYSGTILADTVNITISSSFSTGWPQPLTGRSSLAAVCADLDGDGYKEVIVGAMNGLNVFNYDGTPRTGFPAITDQDARCIPAVYDTDHDGEKEIIVTTATGLYVVNADGTVDDGWPRHVATGTLAFGYPTPTVTQFNPAEDSVITFVNESGDIIAYKFNGDSYFYSLEGYFTSFNKQKSYSDYYGGNSVTAADVTGDNINDVIVSFSNLIPYCGVGLFKSRNGLPELDLPRPQVLDNSIVYGTVLADIYGDSRPEIITSGYDDASVRKIWALTEGNQPVPGWPLEIPEVSGWISNYPTIADLDLDGTPEILLTYFEYDIASLYIFKADGTPYIEREGRPAGEAFYAAVTFGVPMVANLLGDDYPEIIIRGGYIFPGTGSEQVFILDHTGLPVPGWPIATPTRTSLVFSTPYVATVDDIDNDQQVEMILIGENNDVFIWDFEAAYNDGANRARLFVDNLNSTYYQPAVAGMAVNTDSKINPVPPTDTASIALGQSYTNPFDNTDEITFSLAKPDRVKLDVYDIYGREIAVLVDGQSKAGQHTVTLDKSNLNPGVYYYRLKTSDMTQTRKMLVTK